MTYGEMGQLLHANHKLQCTLRNLPYVRLQQQLVYQFISEAEADLQRRVQVLISNEAIDFSSYVEYGDENSIVYVNESGVYYVGNIGSTLFDLPNDFGNLIGLTVNGEDTNGYLDPALFNSTVQNLNSEGTIYYTIEHKDNGVIALKFGPYVPDTNDVVIPIYYKAIRPFYERSIGSNTELQLGTDYDKAIELFVMSKLFRDYEEAYERKLFSAQQLRNSQGYDQSRAELLGGVDNG